METVKKVMCSQCDGAGYIWAAGFCRHCDGGWVTVPSEPADPARELRLPHEEHDIIASPDHYVSAGGLQPIELIMSKDPTGQFCKGNIIKYGFRAGSKPYPNMDIAQSEIKDLEKVIQYAEFRIRQLKGLPPVERA